MKKILTISIFSILFPSLLLSQFVETEPFISCDVCNPVSIHSEDLDKDGDMDIITASSRTGILSWYENDGSGNFINQFFISVQLSKYIIHELDDIISTDIDNDGDIDIITGSHQNISWYENNGGNNFSEEKIISSEINPFGGGFAHTKIYAEDLDKDGWIDIISASKADDEIAWYKNKGGGNFSEQLVISSDLDYARDVFAIDFDRDGDTDIVAASEYISNSDITKIVWYENNGQTAFSSEKLIANLNAGVGSIGIADFDNDEDFDIVTGIMGGQILWYENKGLGNFESNKIGTRIYPRIDAKNIRTIDIDGDNDVDVIATFKNGSVVWYENKNGGNFEEESKLITNNPFSSIDILAEDFNNDGKIDIATASNYDDKIAWYQNDGNGSFLETRISSISAGRMFDIHLADIDGDGDLDAISASTTIAWYKNNGNGFFSEQIIIWSGKGRHRAEVSWGYEIRVDEATKVSTVDIDGDGDLDLISAFFSENKISWFENKGFGNFSEEKVIARNLGNVNFISPVDIDKDGDIDILSTSGWLPSNYDHKLVWHKNNGSGSFSAQNIFVSSIFIAPRSAIVGDIDLDGDLDILSAFLGNHPKIAWFENDGNNSFFLERIITTEIKSGQNAELADIDGDGDLDVLSASYSDNKIAWYENNGSGSFSSQNLISTTAEGARHVYTEDLDNDGDIDVLSTSDLDDKLAWYENNGLGDFSNEKILSVNDFLENDICIGDIDNDGDSDILAAFWKDSRIMWYENLTNKTTSINNQKENRILYSLSPNPFANFLIIEKEFSNNDKLFQLSLFDVTGRQVQTTTLKDITQQISTTHLANGLYFYQVINAEGQVIANGKVIKH